MKIFLDYANVTPCTYKVDLKQSHLKSEVVPCVLIV